MGPSSHNPAEDSFHADLLLRRIKPSIERTHSRTVFDMRSDT